MWIQILKLLFQTDKDCKVTVISGQKKNYSPPWITSLSPYFQVPPAFLRILDISSDIYRNDNKKHITKIGFSYLPVLKNTRELAQLSERPLAASPQSIKTKLWIVPVDVKKLAQNSYFFMKESKDSVNSSQFQNIKTQWTNHVSHLLLTI